MYRTVFLLTAILLLAPRLMIAQTSPAPEPITSDGSDAITTDPYADQLPDEELTPVDPVPFSEVITEYGTPDEPEVPKTDCPTMICDGSSIVEMGFASRILKISEDAPKMGTESSTFPMPYNGITYSVTAYTPQTGLTLDIARTSDYTSVTRASVYRPYGYTVFSDPWISGNPDSSGIGQHKLYLAAVTQNFANLNMANPSSVRVWSNFDGGATWSGAGSEAIVIPSSGSIYSDLVLDRPSIVVSNNAASKGFVYVIALMFKWNNVTQHKIVFIRSRNGVTRPRAICSGTCIPTWDPPTIVADGNGHVLNSPTIAVNPVNGNIYVAWYDSLQGPPAVLSVKYRVSTDYGTTWGPIMTAAGGLTPSDYINSTNPNVLQTKSFVAPNMCWNPVANKLAIVYHNITSLTGSDVYLAYGVPGGTFTSRNLTPTPNAQFLPNVACAPDGRMFVVYYDRNATSDDSTIATTKMELNYLGTTTSGPIRLTDATTFYGANWVGEYLGMTYFASRLFGSSTQLQYLYIDNSSKSFKSTYAWEP